MNRENGATEDEVKKYLEALLEEINFRLLMEQQSEQILWVDNIILISYEPQEKIIDGKGSRMRSIYKALRKGTAFFCGDCL